MNEIKVRVNAKINLTLDILGEYGVGYHELDTIMASIGIYDIVECRKADDIMVMMDSRLQNENNTAYKVAKMCYDKFGVGLCHIDITKGIPFSAGLGGSSADASATLYCLGKLYGLTESQLDEVARAVGSDVAFMLKGGIMHAKGKGDDLSALPFHDYCLVVAKGRSGAMTKQVFEQYDLEPERSSHTADYISAENECDRLRSLGNALQKPAIKCVPEIENTITKLQKYSNVVCMSGSGAGVFAVVPDMDYANALVEKLRKQFSYIKACKVLDYGIKEL